MAVSGVLSYYNTRDMILYQHIENQNVFPRKWPKSSIFYFSFLPSSQIFSIASLTTFCGL